MEISSALFTPQASPVINCQIHACCVFSATPVRLLRATSFRAGLRVFHRVNLEPSQCRRRKRKPEIPQQQPRYHSSNNNREDLPNTGKTQGAGGPGVACVVRADESIDLMCSYAGLKVKLLITAQTLRGWSIWRIRFLAEHSPAGMKKLQAQRVARRDSQWPSHRVLQAVAGSSDW